MTEHSPSAATEASFGTEPDILRSDEIAAELIARADAGGRSSEAHPPAGAVVAIIEGEQQFVSSAGAAHLAANDPIGGPSRTEVMTERHVHDLASVSKVLTTLTLQRLFSQGAAEPSDTLERFFGAAAGHYSAITLEDLLRHRSGMRPWWPLYLAPGNPIDTILALEPDYPARTQCKYSDLGMQTLGEVIARIVEQPFAPAVRELLLEPLRVDTVTPAAPYSSDHLVSGGVGDAVEREMIDTGNPYSVSPEIAARAAEFPWRDYLIRGEVSDCNAFHAFDGVAGHAGWFADAAGLLKIAAVIAEPDRLNIDPAVARQMGLASVPQPASDGYRQCRGARAYNIPWRGEERTFLGHPGFTGTFIAASPATATGPRVLAVMLTNRLHGSPPPARTALASVDGMWRRAMRAAERVLHAPRTGGKQ